MKDSIKISLFIRVSRLFLCFLNCVEYSSQGEEIKKKKYLLCFTKRETIENYHKDCDKVIPVLEGYNELPDNVNI